MLGSVVGKPDGITKPPSGKWKVGMGGTPASPVLGSPLGRPEGRPDTEAVGMVGCGPPVVVPGDVGRVVVPYLSEWTLASKHWEETAERRRVSDLGEMKAPENFI